jgi:glycosyltransferase involved in cell wall biosynthesis
MAEQPCVLIYNPISGHGHLDSWLAMFVALLMERGWRVLVLTPDVQALSTRVGQRNRSGAGSLQILNWNVGLGSFLSRLWRQWNAFGDPYYRRWRGRNATPDTCIRRTWTDRLFQAAVPFLFRASHVLYGRRSFLKEFLHRGRTRCAEVSTGDPERNLNDPAEMAHRTLRALNKARWKPAIALNMYMDMYRSSEAAWRSFAAINKLCWVGIRFVPPPTPREGWYALPAWRGMCFLDEDVCRAYAAALPDKRFAYLPDVTDAVSPDLDSPLAREIRRRAGSRRIVFLGGSIGGQKNLENWFKLIALADPERWFFALVGEIHRGTLTAGDVAALDHALAALPENLLLHAEYLKDDQAFNAVIAVSDVIFAVYRDFRISSNMLGKAAHFRKPVLVSDKYLMGRRVRQYGIGLAVAEDDASAVRDALDALVLNPVPEENFSVYCADFSEERLGRRIDKILRLCIAHSGMKDQIDD